MPRNRSEKSISGDPVLDEYLRAYLRFYNLPWGDRTGDKGRVLRERHSRLIGALTDTQREVISALGRDGYLGLDQTRELFQHEPEFQHGA